MPTAKTTSAEGAAPAAPAATQMKHVYLVDGSGYIFRAYHALPPMTRADGTPTNAVYGYTQMLINLIEQALADEAADYFAVIFDSDRRSFRNDIYTAYKAQRPEPPDELVPQFALVRDATRAFDLPCIEMQGYEADDLIATYARAAASRGAHVTIVSSDKDLMQLVGGTITMWDPIKQRRIGEAEVKERFGVAPDKVVDVQALAGDSIDNVPGVPGIGIKTAAELINTYGDLETLLARAAEIKQPKRRENLIANAELARISKELVTLKDDVPIKEELDSFLLRAPDHGKVVEFLRANQFRTLVNRVEARRNGAPAPAAAKASTATAGAPAGKPAAPAAGPLDCVLVQDEQALEEWIADAHAEGVMAFATQTTSPDATRAELVGFSLCVRPGRACYVPLAHRSAKPQGALDLDPGSGAEDAPRQIDRDRALALLRPLLEEEGVLKIGHNIKYDMVVLAGLGIRIAPVDCSMMISYVLEGGAHSHELEAVAERHLGHQAAKLADVTGTGRSQLSFDQAPLDKACAYAAERADLARKVQQALRPRLLEQRLVSVYETIERPLMQVVAEMEHAGIKVDSAELTRLSDDFAQRLAELEREIHGLAGHEFNIGSPKQLGEVLFDEMSLGGQLSAGLAKKGKTGAYATGADVLEELAALGHDLPARVLDWRQLSKLKSTYTDALLQQINPVSGRVHTCFAMAATSTGRLSSTDPNLQNIPIRTEEGRKIRRAFVAEPSHKLLSVDYSQIELRLAAHMADVAPLKHAFRQGIDIHALTASQVFGVPVEGMDPMVRRRAKAINFGIIYGISAFGLAAQLGIPQGEARAYIAAYFQRYPGILDYMERTKKRARETGYVTTLFGRRCHVPGINDKNPARRSFMERAAINAPLQGTAADIIKRAMVRVPPALAKAGLGARMLLQVHDELLFEVAEAEIEATAKLIKQVMEDAIHPAIELDVPLVAETGIGASWAEAH